MNEELKCKRISDQIRNQMEASNYFGVNIIVNQDHAATAYNYIGKRSPFQIIESGVMKIKKDATESEKLTAIKTIIHVKEAISESEKQVAEVLKSLTGSYIKPFCIERGMTGRDTSITDEIRIELTNKLDEYGINIMQLMSSTNFMNRHPSEELIGEMIKILKK